MRGIVSSRSGSSGREGTIGFVDGAEHLAVAVPALGVVPTLDPIEDRQRQVLTTFPAVLIEKLEQQCPEEGFGHGRHLAWETPAEALNEQLLSHQQAGVATTG